MKKFSDILSVYPHDLEAKLGVLLCDMAFDREYEAKIIFHLYEESKNSNIKDVESLLGDLLREDYIQMKDEFGSIENLYKIDELSDYVEYRDFLVFVELRGGFKRAFEDLIFSTKIVIDSKDDFIEFISQLLENGYTNTALNYLESAVALYPNEDFFQKTLGQLEV